MPLRNGDRGRHELTAYQVSMHLRVAGVVMTVEAIRGQCPDGNHWSIAQLYDSARSCP